MDRQRIGKYTILSQIGKGGMGVVYKAFDPTIGRTLAIKTILFDESGPRMAREEAQARFLREARSIGGLSHPNIVTVYEAGEDQGTSFIAMEYVEGNSLEDILKSGKKFSQNEALRLIIQLADALGHAHRHGIVHRDVKPGNILIDQEGRSRLVDFGIARISASTITQANAIMGTPFYMSPEQIMGKPVDGRADIFAAGAILYELLASEKPFPGEQISTVIYKIVHEDPLSLRSYQKDLPAGLDAIVCKALAKDPDKRYQTCDDLIADITDVLGGASTKPSIAQGVASAPALGETIRIDPAERPSTVPPVADAGAAAPAASRKRGFLWAGLTAAIVGLAAVAVLLFKTSAPERPEPTSAKQVRTSTELKPGDAPPTDKTISIAAPAEKPGAVASEKSAVALKSNNTANPPVGPPVVKTETQALIKAKDAPAAPPVKKDVAEVPPAVKTEPPPKVKTEPTPDSGKILTLLSTARESSARGAYRDAFNAAQAVLRLDPESPEAHELWVSSSRRLAPLEIKTLIDQYVQSYRDGSTPAFLQANCLPELYLRIKKDIDVLFIQYRSFEGSAAEISLDFVESGPDRLEADTTFGLSVTGQSLSSGAKRTLFEGYYKWRWRKTGERWTIADIQFAPVRS